MKFLMKIWEAPQKFLALLVRLFYKCEKTDAECITHEGREVPIKIFLWENSGGMSLSNTIFLPKKYFDVPPREWSEWQCQYCSHEFGHTLQSKKLGWLYLFVIGLPSIIWAGCFDNYRKKHNKSYYSFYTERWADRLGGVKREG